MNCSNHSKTFFPVALVAVLLAAPLAAQVVVIDQINDDQIYQIRSVYNNKCADVEGNSQANGAVAQVYGCHGNSNQRWKLINNGADLFTVVAMHSGKCLDVESSGQNNGRKVQQFTCHGNSNQLWEIVPDGFHVEFIADHSDKCLHVKHVLTRIDDLVQNPCDNGDYQRFQLTVVADCGDGVCELGEGENRSNCPADCSPVCPNGLCEPGEYCSTCPQDCGSCPPASCDPTCTGRTCSTDNDCGNAGCPIGMCHLGTCMCVE